MSELAKSYSSKQTEAEVHKRWEQARVFSAKAAPDAAETYGVVIPPPNVTAGLHLGHALNATIQDVLVRYHRMKGLPTLWMPGTDHAGIATQTVVEKRLLANGIKRLEMGREAFVAKAQEWKDEYGKVILDQFKSIGASCDWDRVRFTMDDICAAAVRYAFYKLFDDGLIYRGKRLVNWDPVTRTALSDDEVEMEEVEGHMWYLKYPLEDGSGHVTVATTRPETMLGDTAVALNPDDPNAAELEGKYVILPIVGRRIPIVTDDYVVMADPESSDAKARYASGFLKVTPAHDTNDYDIGVRHDLDVINIMGPDGAINADYGWSSHEEIAQEAQQFIGLSREDARVAIVSWFEKNGLLSEIRDYTHSVGHSYRSHAPIEPWLSDQWYVAVTDDRLAGSALRAQNSAQLDSIPEPFSQRTATTGDGELTFYPERYAKTYAAWHSNIRDWCISRQLWWGHQIPVWTRQIALAQTDQNVREALEGAEVDQAVRIESKFSKIGASHSVRKVTEDQIEEAVCIPAQETLTRMGHTAKSEPDLICAVEAEGFTRDPDVLDTWFSSALWPLSTMGWPYPDEFPETEGLLETYNPTSLLTTARDIITLWVSRMVMFNRYFFDGEVPFKHVFIHAMIQDGHGQKMSKSLGNGVDPLDILHSHGADAMRYTLVQMTTDTQDVRMPVDMVCPHSGKEFSPELVTTDSGHKVAAPIQNSPDDPSKKMVSLYGVVTNQTEASAEMPLARNTSTKFDIGRNFANKVWNATRFALGRLEGIDNSSVTIDATEADSLALADRWILARLSQTVTAIDTAISNYRFNDVAHSLYDFIWRDVCDRYLEAIKPTISDSPSQQVVLGCVLDAVLRVLHPVCPFITESLWPHVSQVSTGKIVGVELPDSELAALARWPQIDSAFADENVISAFERADALAKAIRTARAQQTVPPRREISMFVPSELKELLEAANGYIESLAGVSKVVFSADETPELVAPVVFEGHRVMLFDMVDAADEDAERERLAKKADELKKQIAGLKGRLANKGYVDNAPAHLVEETKAQLAAAEADLAALN